MFLVSMEKTVRITGYVEIDAGSPEEAMRIVESQMADGSLSPHDVDWNDHGGEQYLENSLRMTGDVEEF